MSRLFVEHCEAVAAKIAKLILIGLTVRIKTFVARFSPSAISVKNSLVAIISLW